MITADDAKAAEDFVSQLNQGRAFLDRMQTHPCRDCRWCKRFPMDGDHYAEYDECVHPSIRNSAVAMCEAQRLRLIDKKKLEGYCGKDGEWWEAKVADLPV